MEYIPLILLILIIPSIHCFSNCSQLRNFTVSASSGHDTPECASGHSNVSCKSLQYLFTKVQSCANITILDHLTLSSSLELSSLTDIVVAGNNASPINIFCKNNSGLVFKSSQRVHLEGLQFISCSTKCPHENADIYPLVDYAALCVSQGKGVAVTSCSFLNGSGTGVIMHDVIGSNHLVDTNFTRNRHIRRESTSGGLIIKRQDVRGEAEYTIDNCHFTDNENHAHFKSAGINSSLGGGLHLHLGLQNSKSVVYLIQTWFSRNTAVQGGGVHVNQSGPESSLDISIHQSLFQFNQAKDKGGGMLLTQNKHSHCTCKLEIVASTFSNNSGEWGGGLAVDGKNVTINANESYWSVNRANKSAYAIAINGSTVLTATIPDKHTGYNFFARFERCQFLLNRGYNNVLNSIGAVQVKHCKAHFDTCNFVSNAEVALNIRKSAYASFAGNTTFEYNSGIAGAAIYVDGTSAISLREGVFLHFEHNHAIIDGGAIYTEPVDNDFYVPDNICVFESLRSQLNSSETYKVQFTNNTAGGDDQSIFVGTSLHCVNADWSIVLFDTKMFTFEPSANGQVASLPNKIELRSSPNTTEGNMEVMLGQYFYLVPNVTDIFNNTAYLFGNLQLVHYNYIDGVRVLDDLRLVGPKVISMDHFTQDNVLFISGNNSYIDYEGLYVEFIFNQPYSYHTAHRKISVRVVDCQVGYAYDSNSGMCECIHHNDVLSCDPHSSFACIRYGYWLGEYGLTDGEAFPCSGQNCQYADGKCPQNSTCSDSLKDFCRLNEPDDLCWDGRGGIMCSSCQQNYSFTFSALRCVDDTTCTHPNTALIVMGIILYWIAIIVFVLVIMNLDLSMGLGFLNGIVYYFSVLSLFTDKTITGPFLVTVINTCIAVTQLSPRIFGDLNVCFVKSWNLNLHHQLFHYVTPLFVIGMIVLFIWLSRYCRCPRVISFAENSPIHAICVLVLFSYTALTYTNFEILKPIRIKGEVRVYTDPEIKYFRPQHLPYAIVALLLECFISLPICLLLLFAPCLTKKVNLVRLRLKPILDDLQACYRPECRWFAGFYCLARQLMYLANTIPSDSLPQENMILHFTNAAILVVHSSFQPYKHRWLNVLDTLLLIDIFFLSFFNLGWSSNFSHRAIPYVLILPAAFYLLLLIIIVTCKRVFKCLWSIKAFRTRLQTFLRSKEANTESTLPRAATHTSIGLDDENKTSSDGDRDKMGSDFFKDYGEREPLLADSNSERATYSSSEAEGLGITGSSLRISALRRFPPRDSNKKSSTN